MHKEIHTKNVAQMQKYSEYFQIRKRFFLHIIISSDHFFPSTDNTFCRKTCQTIEILKWRSIIIKNNNTSGSYFAVRGQNSSVFSIFSEDI